MPKDAVFEELFKRFLESCERRKSEGENQLEYLRWYTRQVNELCYDYFSETLARLGLAYNRIYLENLDLKKKIERLENELYDK